MTVKRILLLIAGFILLSLGGIGLILPILPTTPFVIGAAFCFSYCSPRWYHFIMKSRYFSAYIENFKKKEGVPLQLKIRSLCALWLTLILSFLIAQSIVVRLVLCAVGVGVSIHLLSLKTKKQQESAGEIENSKNDTTLIDPNKDQTV